MPPLLEVDNLSVSFRSRARTVHAVKNLSFSLEPGRTLAIVGESGSGKSVTALAIMRLIEREGAAIDNGAIKLRLDDGVQDLAQASDDAMRHIRGNHVSMIFQEPMTSLNPVLTIGLQLAEVAQRHAGVSRAQALREATEMLERVHLPEPRRKLSQFPHELSGGMRQRAMIAMALMRRPKLLIADEPTTALDVTIQAQILALLAELQADMGMAVMFITHDLGVVAQIADHVVVMRHGEKVEENSVAALFSQPAHPYTQALLKAVPRLGAGGPAALDTAGQQPVLSVNGLTKSFAPRRIMFQRPPAPVMAVRGVSFEVFAGETLAIVGESGCGKSTTARTLMKLVEPDNGEIRLSGRDITKLSRREMQPLRRDIQMVFQDPYAALNPRLAALDLVTEPMAIHAPETSRAERRARAVYLLRRVGLEESHLDRYAHQFSGGQRQRLCIARALCLRPKIIVADEPVSALDVSVQAQVIELMADLQAEFGLAFLFISHDIAVVERVSHRIAVMYAGEIVETGPTAQVLRNPKHSYTKRLLASVPGQELPLEGPAMEKRPDDP